MKRKNLRLRIKTCFEPNRFAKDNLASAYESLCPDKKIAITDKAQCDTPSAQDNQPKSKRTRR